MKPKDFGLITTLNDDTELYTQGSEGGSRGDFKFTLGTLKAFIKSSKQTIIIASESPSITVASLPASVDIYRNGVMMYEDVKTVRDPQVYERDGDIIYASTRFPFQVDDRIDIR